MPDSDHLRRLLMHAERAVRAAVAEAAGGPAATGTPAVEKLRDAARIVEQVRRDLEATQTEGPRGGPPYPPI